MILLAAVLVLIVFYLWRRLNRLEARLSHDEWDFATRLEDLAAEIPDEESARLEADLHDGHIGYGVRIPGCRFCDEEARLLTENGVVPDA